MIMIADNRSTWKKNVLVPLGPPQSLHLPLSVTPGESTVINRP